MYDTALLVIDVQRGFFDGDRIPPVSDSERVLARIGDVVRRARATGLPVVYVQHAGGSGHLLE
jgi:nicotinamidase-related amidase